MRAATVNPEFLLKARSHQPFREALAGMTHCTVEGTGFHWFLTIAQKALNLSEPSTLYHGADLVEDLLVRYQDGSRRFFLLGAAPGIAVKAADVIRERFPQICIVGADDGGQVSETAPLTASTEKALGAASPDIVLVAFGAPKQELWIAAASKLPPRCMIGIGGTLAFYGSKQRAPQALRKLHLEWLWRAATERGHARRAWRAVVLFPLWALFRLATGRAA